MKTLLLLLITATSFSQVQNFGELQIQGNTAFHTELKNKGKINGSEILVDVEGDYFLLEKIELLFVKITGNDVRVALNGNPVIGVYNNTITQLSESNVTDYVNPNNYDQIRIGARLLKTQYWDMKGSYIGTELQGVKGIYIELKFYNDGTKQSKKIKI